MKKKTRMLKVISMVLILFLVVGIIPLEVIAQNADGTGEVIAAVTQSENHNIEGEVVSERTDKTKTFLRKDGTKTVAASMEQLHNYDEKEGFTEIDNNLETDSNNKEMITNKQNDLNVKFPKELDNDTPVVVTNKKHAISFKLQNEILA